MMTHRQAFVRGLSAGVFVMVATQAMHWLLTPMSHPGASDVRHWFVAAPFVARARGVGAAPEPVPRGDATGGGE